MAHNDTTLLLTIDSLAYGPFGVGRDQRRVILVPLTAPGDRAEVRLVAEKKNYATAELIRLDKASLHRQTPPCPYFATCGGCPWQHISYPQQLSAKESIIQESLRRIGGFSNFDLLPIIPSPKEYHYRRRIRLQCDPKRTLGFYRAFSHELVEVDACSIADSEINQMLSLARAWAGAVMTSLHHVEIVTGDEGGKAVLVGKGAAEFANHDDDVSARFLTKRPEISGLVLYGRRWRRSWGDPRVVLVSDNHLRLEIDADVFSQVNQVGSRQLVRELMAWGAFDKRDRVLELYSGAGNFTLPMAQEAREVIAVEQNRRAVENGRTNSRLNRLKNIRWIASDVGNAVGGLSREGHHFQKMVLNPPRTGAKGIEISTPRFGAEKILYVSCNPTTLARDLSALRKQDYTLTRVQPFDLFPHTFHVETLAEMVR